MLVSGKVKVSRGFAKLKEDFGLADSAVTKAFIKVKTVSSEMFCQKFPSQNLKVSVRPKIDHFSKKLFFTFSDRYYYDLSFKKSSEKKD